MKDKNYMITSIDAGKLFATIHHFMIKILNLLCMEEMQLNIIKAIYDKLTANTLLNGEQVKDFSPRSLSRQGKWKWKSLSHVQLFVTPWTDSPWNSPGQTTGLGSLSLLQGIVPTQESNPGLPHCRKILYQLSHKDTHSYHSFDIALEVPARIFRQHKEIKCT